MFEKLTSFLPEMPSLGREVEIPVYLIHTTEDAEDYFFLFDFEQFAEASKGGSFVRPKLKILAGRSDFSRTIFAGHFRETFQREFDRMRADLGKTKNRGWLTWETGANFGMIVSGVVGALVLAIAVSAGRATFGRVTLPRWIKGKSKEAGLDAEIEGLKSRVDQALAEHDIVLHPELHERARTLGGPANRAGMMDDAWPLPAHVAKHLNDGDSGSWW